MDKTRSTGNAANLLLWFIFLGGPVAWGVALQTDYALVPWVCLHQKLWVLHLVASAFLLVPALIVVLAWRNWRQPVDRDEPAFGEMVRDRARFMALMGLMTASFFFLVMLAQVVSTFVFDPCAY